MKFLIASTNVNKQIEFARIFNELGLSVLFPSDVNVSLDDVEETGSSFEENALIKASHAMMLTGIPSVADDSGLMIDALGGAPGIYSARYAGENATDSDRISLVLANMQSVPAQDRTAHFICAICCIFPDGRVITSKGVCDGKIAYEPLGENGFGYDPIFIVEDGRTFASLTSTEKDQLSHRGKALRLFSEKIKSII